MNENNGGAVALLADEAPHAAGLESAPGRAVDIDHLGHFGMHATIITAISA